MIPAIPYVLLFLAWPPDERYYTPKSSSFLANKLPEFAEVAFFFVERPKNKKR